MSDFDEARQELAEGILAGFGVAATYTFADSTTLEITAILDQNVEVLTDDDRGLRIALHTIKVSADDVPSPARGETVTIDGRAWKIGPQIDNHGGLNHHEVS